MRDDTMTCACITERDLKNIGHKVKHAESNTSFLKPFPNIFLWLNTAPWCLAKKRATSLERHFQGSTIFFNFTEQKQDGEMHFNNTVTQLLQHNAFSTSQHSLNNMLLRLEIQKHNFEGDSTPVYHV